MIVDITFAGFGCHNQHDLVGWLKLLGQEPDGMAT
jgi:hypothetical protein